MWLSVTFWMIFLEYSWGLFVIDDSHLARTCYVCFVDLRTYATLVCLLWTPDLESTLCRSRPVTASQALHSLLFHTSSWWSAACSTCLSCLVLRRLFLFVHHWSVRRRTKLDFHFPSPETLKRWAAVAGSSSYGRNLSTRLRFNRSRKQATRVCILSMTSIQRCARLAQNCSLKEVVY